MTPITGSVTPPASQEWTQSSRGAGFMDITRVSMIVGSLTWLVPMRHLPQRADDAPSC